MEKITPKQISEILEHEKLRYELCDRAEQFVEYRPCLSFVSLEDIDANGIRLRIEENVGYGGYDIEYLNLTWDDLNLTPEEYWTKARKEKEEKAQIIAKQKKAMKEANEREEYERLKKKFEGEN